MVRVISMMILMVALAGCSSTRVGLAKLDMSSVDFKHTEKMTSPYIYAGPGHLINYMRTKYYMGRVFALPEFRQAWSRELIGSRNSGDAYLYAETYLDHAARHTFNRDFSKEFAAKAAKQFGGNIEAVMTKGSNGEQFWKVTESAMDCDVAYLASYFPKKSIDGLISESCKETPLFVSYYAMNAKGVMVGQTFAPEFIPGAVGFYVGKINPTTAPELVATSLSNQVKTQPKIAMVEAAVKGQDLCENTAQEGFCGVSPDDRAVIRKALAGGEDEAMALVRKLEPEVVRAGHEGQKELSW